MVQTETTSTPTSSSTSSSPAVVPCIDEPMQVQLSTETTCAASPFDQASEQTALLSIIAPTLPDDKEKERAPVLISACLDVSGSMSGEKIKLLKETMMFAIKQMRPEDQLAIVAYETEVEVVMGLTTMNEEGIKTATAAVNSLTPKNLTNMSGGLQESLRLVPTELAANVVPTVLLLTDGQANRGIKTATGIISMIRDLDKRESHRCPINCFGYGSDANGDMLCEIAESSEGMYYFIENPDAIASSFADCVGGLMSTVAQTLSVDIEALGDVEISRVETHLRCKTITQGKKYQVTMADLQSEERRDIPVTFKLPSLSTNPEGQTQVLNVALNYFNVISEKMENVQTSMTVIRDTDTATGKVEFTPSIEIDVHRNRIMTVDVMKQARTVANSGDYARARQILQEAITKIQSSPSANEPQCKRLIVDMEDIMRNDLVDRTAYRKKGAQKMANAGYSHACQRSAPVQQSREMSQFTYCNKSKMKMQSKFA